MWPDLAVDPKSKGEGEGEREEHDEHEEHEELTHAHLPDTTDTYPRGSMDHADRISYGRDRGRIPR